MIPLKEFMVSPVVHVDIQATVKTAALLMAEKKIGSILVKEGEDMVGIVTKTNMVYQVLAEGRDGNSVTVGEIMSQPLISMDAYVFRSEANELMLRKNIHHLVVTQAKKVVGILTLKDMVT